MTDEELREIEERAYNPCEAEINQLINEDIRALIAEIRRLKGQAVNAPIGFTHLGSGLAKWSQSFQPPDGIDPERE